MRAGILVIALGLLVAVPVAVFLAAQVLDYWGTLGDAFGWWGILVALAPIIVIGTLALLERR